MHRIVNIGHAFIVVSLFMTVNSYAGEIGLNSEAPAQHQEVDYASTPVGVGLSSEPRHQDSMAAVDFASLPKHLSTQQPVILAKRDEQDCKDATGALHTAGKLNEQTLCDPGWVPYKIVSSHSATDTAGRLWQDVKEAGSVLSGRDLRGITYQLVCCKAYVGYS